MRLHLLSFISSGCSLLLCGAAAAAPTQAVVPPHAPPELVLAPVDKIFAPQGFDDNDNIEVILHGQFPNACYQAGPVTSTVDKTTNTITVDAKSYRAQAVLCAEVLIKFIEPVKIGILPKGTYRIVLKDNPRVAPVNLVVDAAKSSSQDDHLYAPVSNASMDVNEEGHDILRLEGNYPYMLIGCMVDKDVRADYSSNDVLIVKPIAHLVDNDECLPQRKSMAFKLQKDLGQHRVGKDYLIHVRTLNGNAVNRLIDGGLSVD